MKSKHTSKLHGGERSPVKFTLNKYEEELEKMVLEDNAGVPKKTIKL
jgi:hypothetical protein